MDFLRNTLNQIKFLEKKWINSISLKAAARCRLVSGFATFFFHQHSLRCLTQIKKKSTSSATGKCHQFPLFLPGTQNE